MEELKPKPGKFYLYRKTFFCFIYKAEHDGFWACHLNNDRLHIAVLYGAKDFKLTDCERSLYNRFVRGTQEHLKECLDLRGLLGNGSIPVLTAAYAKILDLLATYENSGHSEL